MHCFVSSPSSIRKLFFLDRSGMIWKNAKPSSICLQMPPGHQRWCSLLDGSGSSRWPSDLLSRSLSLIPCLWLGSVRGSINT